MPSFLLNYQILLIKLKYLLVVFEHNKNVETLRKGEYMFGKKTKTKDAKNCSNVADSNMTSGSRSTKSCSNNSANTSNTSTNKTCCTTNTKNTSNKSTATKSSQHNTKACTSKSSTSTKNCK